MKTVRHSCFRLLVLAAWFLPAVASAQIVMQPDITGSSWGPCGSGVDYDEHVVMQVGCCNSCGSNPYYGVPILWDDMFAVAMFKIKDQTFLKNLTQSNFTAKLESLSVASSQGNGTMQVYLSDVPDQNEIYGLDGMSYGWYGATPILHKTHAFHVNRPANFTDVDVTKQLRHDLFEADSNVEYSAFLLRAVKKSEFKQRVCYDYRKPKLAINVQGLDAGIVLASLMADASLGDASFGCEQPDFPDQDASQEDASQEDAGGKPTDSGTGKLDAGSHNLDASLKGEGGGYGCNYVVGSPLKTMRTLRMIWKRIF